MKNKRGSLIISILILIVLIVGGIYYASKKFDIQTDITINLNEKNESQNQTNEQTKIANPASVNCIEKGHKLEMRISKNKGEYGVCIDKMENECEEWEYFRKKCKLNETQV